VSELPRGQRRRGRPDPGAARLLRGHSRQHHHHPSPAASASIDSALILGPVTGGIPTGIDSATVALYRLTSLGIIDRALALGPVTGGIPTGIDSATVVLYRLTSLGLIIGMG